jgi:HPt (histidine-containing phosphotransfer) domain-containing protein
MNPRKYTMDNNDPLTPVPTDHTPVLCSATMASLRDEGEDFLLDLIKLFLSEVPMRLAALTAALAEGNRSVARRAAHTLKSTAAVFGADTLQAIAAAIELAASAGEMREVARMLPDLCTVAEQVRLVLLIERKKILSSHLA